MMTIMTPTYNRAYILQKLYESLCNQTNKNFEWIVIDDGSTDNTEELVKQWIEDNPPFEIVYRKMENGGKQRAINAAVRIAKYDWFNIVDSDDFLVPNAVEQINEWIKSIENDDTIAGVSGLRGYIDTDRIIGSYPVSKKYEHYIDTIPLPYYWKKSGLKGDKDEVLRTKLFKQFPFPEFESENFISESVFWDKIGQDGLKIRYFNEVTRKCEYLQDGLTHAGAKLFTDNFEGYTLATKIRLKNPGWLLRCSCIRSYFRLAKLKGLRFHEAKEKLGITIFKAYTAYAAKIISTTMNLLRIFRR